MERVLDMNDFQPYDCDFNELLVMIEKNREALASATRNSVFYQMVEDTLQHLENVKIFREMWDKKS
jgi:hypothetical protein